MFSAFTKAALFGWIGGLLGIGALNALEDAYQRSATDVDDEDDVVVAPVVGAVVVGDVVVEVCVGGGAGVGAGAGGGATTAEGAELVAVEPFLLVAVTTIRSVEPTSACVSA